MVGTVASFHTWFVSNSPSHHQSADPNEREKTNQLLHQMPSDTDTWGPQNSKLKTKQPNQTRSNGEYGNHQANGRLHNRVPEALKTLRAFFSFTLWLKLDKFDLERTGSNNAIKSKRPCLRVAGWESLALCLSGGFGVWALKQGRSVAACNSHECDAGQIFVPVSVVSRQPPSLLARAGRDAADATPMRACLGALAVATGMDGKGAEMCARLTVAVAERV